MEGGGVLAPEGADRGDVLDRARGAAAERHPERVELLLRPADADPEGEAAAAEQVERRRLLGDQDRVVLWEEEDAGRQRDRPGGGGGEAEASERIQPVGVGRDRDGAVLVVGIGRGRPVDHDHVLAGPEPGEAGVLGRPRHRIDDVPARARADSEGVETDPRRHRLRPFRIDTGYDPAVRVPAAATRRAIVITDPLDHPEGVLGQGTESSTRRSFSSPSFAPWAEPPAE